MTDEEKHKRILELKHKLKHGFTDEEKMDANEIVLNRWFDRQKLIDGSANVIRFPSKHRR